MQAFLVRIALALALAFFPSAAFAQQEVNHLNKPVTATAISVGATATKLITSPDLSRWRRGVLVQPTNGDIYIGDAGVTTANGVLVTSGQFLFIEWTFGNAWHGIRSGGSNVDVRVVQVY